MATGKATDSRVFELSLTNGAVTGVVIALKLSFALAVAATGIGK